MSTGFNLAKLIFGAFLHPCATHVGSQVTPISAKVIHTIMNLDLIMKYYSYATFSTFSLLIKALAPLFNILYLSKASQASLLGLIDFCTYLPVLISL
jgi:hypothetical protein